MTQTEGFPQFTQLPRDLVIQVFGFLLPNELRLVSLASKWCNTLANDEMVWKTLCIKCYYESSVDAEKEKPKEFGWKEQFRNLSCSLVDCGSQLRFTKDKRTVHPQQGGVLGHIAEMAVGRPHANGRHKYTLLIEDNSYVGVGVGPEHLIGHRLKGDSLLHKTVGCSVYYYTGYWYGRKGDMNAYAQYKEFLSNDIINVYFDVELQKVKYFNGDKLLLSCYVNGTSNQPKPLRLVIVLGQQKSRVTITGYTRVRELPPDETTEYEQTKHYSSNTYGVSELY